MLPIAKGRGKKAIGNKIANINFQNFFIVFIFLKYVQLHIFSYHLASHVCLHGPLGIRQWPIYIDIQSPIMINKIASPIDKNFGSTAVHGKLFLVTNISKNLFSYKGC